MQFQYIGKNANVYKTNFFTLNFKSTLCITLLKAKLLAKIIEISIRNKKNCCKERKGYNVLGKQLSYLASTFSVAMYVDTVFCAFVRSFANK